MYKLLICDDEALERIVLRKMIEKRYADITILDDAKNGDEAVQSVQRYLPDILLIDIKMPELNGIDAQKQIVAFHPAIKTVIITAYSDFSYAHAAIKHNIVDFLLKPVPPAELYTCLDTIRDQLHAETSRAEKQEQAELTAVQQATAYIDAHYMEGLRISDVAERVNLSEKYFSRYFKQQTGMTFTDYLNLRLIKKAKGLLLHTTTPVYKIAMDLSFSDSAYFTKVFRKYEKTTPLKFRQKYGGKSRG
jgi:Response regulator containing CheY-like receiver domain and AraC-type DNA-binding domain